MSIRRVLNQSAVILRVFDQIPSKYIRDSNDNMLGVNKFLGIKVCKNQECNT